MENFTSIIETFPSVRIPSMSGGLDIEVSLIAQLGHGSGNHLFASVKSRQQQHKTFIDELDEPSAKLGATNFAKGDPSALYSFAVGPLGHPFHRHAGSRIFMAVSGSGGAQLRFSTASLQQIHEDPNNFIKALHYVNIPPDCLFTVRFGGETWHQFSPLNPNGLHPAFFALSCHVNELGGELTPELQAKILADKANIPTLTSELPQEVMALLSSKEFQESTIPVTTLSLDAPAGTLQRKICDLTRGNLGRLRGAWGSWKSASGYLSHGKLKKLNSLTEDSLLNNYLADKNHHEDTVVLTITGDFKNKHASSFLALVLEGFLKNSPGGVASLMRLRNVLVKPFGLNTSPLGCPVSSLLSSSTVLFANRFPVIDQKINATDSEAQVILGVDDKHLRFRSCVGVKIISDYEAEITLGTRVQCINLFGRFYMASIAYLHKKYIAPKMLKQAVTYALGSFTL